MGLLHNNMATINHWESVISDYCTATQGIETWWQNWKH